MLKKLTALLLAGIVSATSITVFAADPKLDVTSANEKGVVKGTADATIAKKTMIKVEKDKTNYVYVVRKNEDSSFPLQMGNGSYSVGVLEQVEGTKYKYIDKKDISLDLKDSKVVYNNSIQNIAWTKDSEAAKKAAELVKGKTTTEDKVKAIYDFITKTVVYDFDKIDKITSDYVPSPDATLKEKKGICYDYSALFAAMLRSQGISAKLIKGECDAVDVYHAWNEVYLDSQKKWVVMDTTVDAVYVEAGQKVDMYKNAKTYRAQKEY